MVAASTSSWLSFSGVMLTTFGPAAVLIKTVIAPQPDLIILAILAAFAWLMVISCVAIVWLALVPLRDTMWLLVVYGVLAQEAGRYGTYRVYQRLLRGLDKVGLKPTIRAGGESVSSQLVAAVPPAIACGVGVGLAQTVIMYGDFLLASLKPGTLYNPSCRALSEFALDAICSLAMLVLNVLLTLLGWTWAYPLQPRGASRAARMAMVVGLHWLASGSTMLNGAGPIAGLDGCALALPCLLATVALAGWLTWHAATTGMRGVRGTSTQRAHGETAEGIALEGGRRPTERLE
jgi:hypothetical protein